MPLIPSWLESANDPAGSFPLNNLPLGVFSISDGPKRCGVAVGDAVLDVKGLHADGLLPSFDEQTFAAPAWNDFMALGPSSWRKFREELQALLGSDCAPEIPARIKPLLIPLKEATLHLPFAVTEFTDFYSGMHHATNVGTMFRGADNALPPNWLHMPIAYNGRASSVVVSGTDIVRPNGQLKGPDEDLPRFGPSQRFDIELELGAIVGQPSDGPLSVAEADQAIFGYVLLNDWSARDIQAWEYQPLGPFQAKATATTISPWIIMAEALHPFRCDPPQRETPLLPHLRDSGPMSHEIDLSISLTPADGKATTIAETNACELYYSAAQQLAHHTASGCPMRVGDLLGSGTISGPTKNSRGSLLELSWGGKEPFNLDDGTERSFIKDGDMLNLNGVAKGDGYCIGFGDCSGRLLPARKI